MGPFPFPLPEGEDAATFFQKKAEEAEAAAEQHNMQEESRYHQMMQYLADLDKDGLVSLLYLLRACSSSQETLVRVIGMVQGRLRFEHGLCAGCGQDHALELLREAHNGSGETGSSLS